jgi:competence protein ComGF
MLYLQKQRNALPLSEQGFTLLEVMFAFSIFTTIVFFLTPVLQIILNNEKSEVRLQEMEWEVFCSQVKKEIRSVSKAEVVSGRLVLSNNNETIYYEKLGTNLRRRVNSSGHEVLLQNVVDVTFFRLKNAVKINVKDSWGHDYSVIIHSYIDWK